MRNRFSALSQAPGYKERNRLRKSAILHPTDFGQIQSRSQSFVPKLWERDWAKSRYFKE